MPKVRLMIDFPDVDSLKGWVRASLADDTLPPDAAVFEMDGLDDKTGPGITKAHTYIVRRAGDRPEQTRLRLEP